jgi:hypothetical protein
MRKCFDWLVEHEKLLIGIVLVLVVCLVLQQKFCKPTAELNDGFVLTQPPRQLENSLGSAPNIAGVWEMSLQKKSGTNTWTLKLEQDGERLSGIINSEGGDLPVSGTIKGQNISLSAKRFGVTVEFPGVLNGDTMTGKMKVLSVDRQWTAKRRL